MAERTKIINELWDKIHGEYLSLFYWSDDTRTAYFYDEETNSIKSDNGFSVSVDKSTEELDEDYICKLIDELETKIILYYIIDINLIMNCGIFNK